MSRAICMLVHGPYPVGEPRVARQARAAAAAGYEVDVICMRRPEEPQSETLDGVRIHRLPLEHQRGVGLWTVVREYVGFTLLAGRRLTGLARRRRFRVVHVHNPPDFLLLAALPAKLLFGARLVFDVHDLAPDMFAERFGAGTAGRIANAVLAGMERLALRLADEVVTVHEPYARELRERGARPGVSVVMNSVDPDVLPSTNGHVTESTGFRVVYHGTVTPWYGVDLVVDAAGAVVSEIPELVVEIYGEGDAVPGLRERTEQLGLDGRVQFHDRWLPHAEVLSRVRHASAGVIPNRPTRLNRYALSSKLLEYVELGIPVAVAGLPTLREHFADDEVLFFTPGDAGSLAAALLAISADPEAAQARAEAARRRARAYAWDTNAARYVRLLDGLS
ncbi:MAG TPA: glycosyltransferase [Gaiellaceae bacterium]|nr:glycosyltransferase [Gaiellaceae bacterium]